MRSSFILPFLLLVLTAAGQNFYVINAGHTQANGMYTYTGEVNGFPNWANGQYSMHYTYDIGCTPKWVIMNADTMIYKNYSTTYFPPMLDWQTTCYTGSIFPAPYVLSEQPYIQWTNGNYRELNDNTGQVSGQPCVTATLFSYSGSVFTGSNGDDLIATGRASCLNVPAGLNMQVIKTSDTTLQIEFTGHALQHSVSNSLYNCTVVLHSNATTANDSLLVINNNYPYIYISFLQPQLYSYYMYFNELPDDIGMVENLSACKITINRFGGESFSGTIGENFFLTGKVFFNNLPAGLQPEIILVTDTLLSVAMLGSAIHHDNSNDIYSVPMFFRSSSFSGNDSTEVIGHPVNMSFNFFGTIGINTINNVDNLNVFPNPVSKFFFLPTAEKDDMVDLYDMQGRKVLSAAYKDEGIDVSQLEPGLYRGFLNNENAASLLFTIIKIPQ